MSVEAPTRGSISDATQGSVNEQDHPVLVDRLRQDMKSLLEDFGYFENDHFVRNGTSDVHSTSRAPRQVSPFIIDQSNAENIQMYRFNEVTREDIVNEGLDENGKPKMRSIVYVFGYQLHRINPVTRQPIDEDRAEVHVHNDKNNKLEAFNSDREKMSDGEVSDKVKQVEELRTILRRQIKDGERARVARFWNVAIHDDL